MTALSPQRVGRVTASRVPAILGVSPYGDRDSVMREMVRERLGLPSEFTGNIATEWGTDHEPEAITEYEKYRGVMVHNAQVFVVHRSIDYLGCTPDGLIGETGMVEAKCPYRAGYTSIEERPDYYEQIQHQLEVLDREWCDFVVWRPSGLAVSRVGRDPGWWANRGDHLDAFIAEYEDIIYDTDRHQPFMDDADQTPVRDDFDWQMAALEYLEARAAADRAEKAREAARATLITLAGGEPARGAGVALSVDDRRGAVDYKRLLAEHLPTVDLESYRKPSSVVTTVRVAS